MKWNTFGMDQVTLGDKRRRKIFAYWPKRCSDNTTRWLEYVYVHEKVIMRTDGFGACVSHPDWAKIGPYESVEIKEDHETKI